jgi:hypothetical protein
MCQWRVVTFVVDTVTNPQPSLKPFLVPTVFVPRTNIIYDCLSYNT